MTSEPASIRQEDQLVGSVVQRIAEAIKPEQIILFGSRAKGMAGLESDIDLVVVYSGPKSKREIELDIYRLFRHPTFSLDVFIMTPQELDNTKRIANSLAREAVENGVVC
ncbi:MAG: nucleotidyltransferase domain-containing protein [Deltaproteobacteria bacterium]|nr:nucleotidyltransferase domain-containing protein [Deltaproteobacteria bacterium]